MGAWLEQWQNDYGSNQPLYLVDLRSIHRDGKCCDLDVIQKPCALKAFSLGYGII